jgi:aminoglycoside 6-adenylyltransferase
MFIDYALSCDQVRAVTLEGSRTNPNAPKDWLQDFDISFHVADMDFFIGAPSWIDGFGERMIMQTPEDMSLFPSELGRRFSYLILFTDGNKVDLTLIPLDEVEEYCKEDKLMTVLMDKDGRFPDLPPPTDRDYWVERPTAEYYADCCNEFWMVSTYVAKGLWRKEILFALEHLNLIARPMLMKMIEWNVGIDTDFSVSIGKNGKYLEKYTTEQTWQKLMSTYPNGTYEAAWSALFAMIELFRGIAVEVAERLNFRYPIEEDSNVTAYLLRIHN